MLYYFCANYEFFYKEYFLIFEKTIYASYKNYIESKLIIYTSLEILGLIFYIFFYFSINIFLYYSNEIIIKNLIFLFLDFSEDGKNYKIFNNDSNKKTLKLIEFEKIIHDFDLNNLEKYAKKLYKIDNKKIYISKNKMFNYISNDINYNENNEESITGKRESLISFKSSIISKKLNEQIYNKIVNPKNKDKNESFESNINIKDKSKNTSFNTSKDILANNNSNLDASNYKTKINDNIVLKNDENEDNENYFYLLLNKSNKAYILLIKIYILLMIVIIILILTFCIFKIQYTITFNQKIKNYYKDFTSISNRYSFLFYYFNILRTLIIFPEDERKKKFENIMIEIDKNYEKINQEFFSALSNNDQIYKEIFNFINILLYSKNNSTEKIKEEICGEKLDCIDYLDSNFNIFDSGIDFAYRSCITNIKNIFSDYQKIINKTNINDINSTLFNTESSEFIRIGLGLSHTFFYVQEKLYEYFDIDITNFVDSYNQKMSLFNIITIIISFLMFLFVIIIIFYTIFKYSYSLKDSTYRINCSFYYIKYYNLNIFKK